MFPLQIDRWFKPHGRGGNVKIGSVFRNVRRGNIVETARVLNIIPDSMGVPHVHYKVSIHGSHKQSFEELRTLGLVSFAQRFTEALSG